MNRLYFFSLFLLIASWHFACQGEKSNIENGKNASGSIELREGSIADFSDSLLTVAFYNVENLFDIYDDPKTNDNQFLPSSEKEWTAERYGEKLKNLAKVFSAIEAHASDSPDLIGLVEIENEQVIKDLIGQFNPSDASYKIVHEDSPDERGIDVGFVYNENVFTYLSHENIRVYFEQDPKVKTRDILYIRGSVNGEVLHVFVNHWSSRRDGEKETEFKRLACARMVKQKIFAIQKENAEANILLMGDFNDYPNNNSLVNVIGANNSNSGNSFFNLASAIHERGEGTYNYRGKWGMLDQMILSDALKNDARFQLSTDELYILKEEWMLYQHPKYKDFRPNRSYGGPNYYGGYSDHLPVYIQFNLNF
ncbi:MAG: endonuclease [Bacteroidota bacterium]